MDKELSISDDNEIIEGQYSGAYIKELLEL